MKITPIPFIIAALITIQSCERLNQSGNSIDDEILVKTALSQGEIISSSAQKALGSQLTRAMAEGGPVHAVRFCNTAAYTILDTLETIIPTRVKRVSLKVRNPEDTPSETEKSVLESFTLEMENGIETPGPRIIPLPDNRLIYLKPIILNNPICLNCHGEAGSQVAQETYELIHELYPNDNAMNHVMGDLRGAWSITFNKSDLIDYLEKNSRD